MKLKSENQIEFGQYKNSNVDIRNKRGAEVVVQSSLYSVRSHMNLDEIDHNVKMRTGIENSITQTYFDETLFVHDLTQHIAIEPFLKANGIGNETLFVHDLTQHIAIEPFLKANGIGNFDKISLSQEEELRQQLILCFSPKTYDGRERSSDGLIKIPNLSKIVDKINQSKLQLEKYELEQINDPDLGFDIKQVKVEITYLEKILIRKTEEAEARSRFRNAALLLKSYLETYLNKGGIEKLVGEKTIEAIAKGKLHLTVEHYITESESNVIPKIIVSKVNKAIEEYCNFITRKR